MMCSNETMCSKPNKEVKKMLDAKDLELLQSIISEMDKRFAKSEASMIAEMDKRFAKSENLVLEELERTRRILDQKIQNMQDNLDAITEYYRITKLEQDNTVLFLGMVSDLQKRVEKLEQKIA